MAAGTTDYMMRSEKRPGSSRRPDPAEKKRRNKKRAPRAGFFYIFFTLIFLIILWPVGVIMLWRRKIRWNFGTKLLLTLASLCIVFLAGAFALTKDTGDPQITAMQDRANDMLDSSFTAMTHASEVFGRRGKEAFEIGKSVGDGVARYTMALLADGIDDALDAVQPLRDRIEEGIGRPITMSTATPVPTEEPTPEPTQELTEAPTATPRPTPATTPAQTENTQDAEAVQAEFVAKSMDVTEIPTEEPTQAPTEEPTEEPTEAPTPEPTPEPTPVVEVVYPSATLKPAGEATVYHSSNGRYYHSVQKCKGMSGSKAYTLAECVDGYKACNTCHAPKKELVDQLCLWKDKDGLCHTSDTCSEFKGSYTLVERDAALEEGLKGCLVCGADEYLQPDTIIGE